MKKSLPLVIIGLVLVIAVGAYFFFAEKSSAKDRAVQELKDFQSSRACTRDNARLVHKPSGATYEGSSNCQPDGPLPSGWEVDR